MIHFSSLLSPTMGLGIGHKKRFPPAQFSWTFDNISYLVEQDNILRNVNVNVIVATLDEYSHLPTVLISSPTNLMRKVPSPNYSFVACNEVPPPNIFISFFLPTFIKFLAP